MLLSITQEVGPSGDVEEGDDQEGYGGGMNLSFQPMLLTFTDICYFVDMPSVPQLLLLSDNAELAHVASSQIIL